MTTLKRAKKLIDEMKRQQAEQEARVKARKKTVISKSEAAARAAEARIIKHFLYHQMPAPKEK